MTEYTSRRQVILQGQERAVDMTKRAETLEIVKLIDIVSSRDNVHLVREYFNVSWLRLNERLKLPRSL